MRRITEIYRDFTQGRTFKTPSQALANAKPKPSELAPNNAILREVIEKHTKEGD